MQKNNGMRPQDIVILLKILTFSDDNWTSVDISRALEISTAEISGSLERSRIAGLLSQNKREVNTLALREFLIHGLKYVFPAEIGAPVRGIATAHSASPIKEQISEGKDNYVWSYSRGTRRGNSILPLYRTVPKVAGNQKELYEYLVITDTLRVGRVREIEIAINELDKKLNSHGQ
ncbi:MAG: hypothetical protein LBV74_04115 [Tannerella sp.]|jgi:hypothetical protein|nr:hypothetical protein [Tannerella sp.]